MADVETGPRERAAGVPGSQAQPYLAAALLLPGHPAAANQESPAAHA